MGLRIMDLVAVSLSLGMLRWLLNCIIALI